MRITPRILVLAIFLLLISCTKWGSNKKASRDVDIYSDVEMWYRGTIRNGSVCRIDQRISDGKVYGFHKIECKNGQSGYLMLGDDQGAFDPRIERRPRWGADKRPIRPVDLYSDAQETARSGTVPIGTICRIDGKSSAGKLLTYNKIECQNGQSGYVEFGEGWKAFEFTHSASNWTNLRAGENP